MKRPYILEIHSNDLPFKHMEGNGLTLKLRDALYKYLQIVDHIVILLNFIEHCFCVIHVNANIIDLHHAKIGFNILVVVIPKVAQLVPA